MREPKADLEGASIVFDLDGTLVDTAPDLIGATNHVLAARDLPPVPGEDIRQWISFGARRMVTEAFALSSTALSDSDTDALLDLFLDYYVENIARESRAFAGVPEALSMLEGRGAILAVCTNKREHLSRLLLDALGLTSRFAFIAGRDTFPVFKPDPEHLFGAIRHAKGDPARAVMIGDSATDIRTARAADIPVIGVTFGYTDIPVQDLGPDAIVENYVDLPCALDKIFSGI